MKQCWRWFGPNDKIPLSDLHQVGVQGIVTALHDHPPGQVWNVQSIRQRMELLERAGFRWEVVESLPVSEDIKTKSSNTHDHLDNYCQSIRNLAACGITTVCYNFMPILDWTRTELRAEQPHGGTAMRFSLLDFSVFDLHILQRVGADNDYTGPQKEMAARRFHAMSDSEKSALQSNIIAGLPGANDSWTLDDVSTLLESYDQIDATQLRNNLVDFLSEVCPVAEEVGVKLCCHPDDPPFGLLGLPRVMSNTADYTTVLTAVHTQANGATLCTGSLGVSKDFDPMGFIQTLGDRIHFAHLRNTKRIDNGDPIRPDFFEAAHLEGDTDMVATIKALAAEEDRRKKAGRSDWEIPMRPDHGQELLSDMTTDSMPGYPLIGRMRGLAELRGIMAAVSS